ncbi:MAG: YicC/YloC family endoribonuclease [Pseudohongiellaceae bacterium]
MVASMTAFARQQQEHPWGTLSWEIRALNHRYLEAGIRVPEMLRPLEPKVRELLRQRISRGKVDCQLRFQPAGQGERGASLNEEMLEALRTLDQQIRKVHPEAASLSVSDLLKWPGVLQEPEPDVDDIASHALKQFHTTLEAFVEARQREGGELATAIEKRLDAISGIVVAVREQLPDILARQKTLLVERLGELREELDPARLEQEIALLAQKSDVDEELDRLDAHITEVRRVLTLSEPIGRRLDFLMQELNREANTLSSKSVVAETTRQAVELKVLIEQMREQVQNIE